MSFRTFKFHEFLWLAANENHILRLIEYSVGGNVDIKTTNYFFKIDGTISFDLLELYRDNKYFTSPSYFIISDVLLVVRSTRILGSHSSATSEKFATKTNYFITNVLVPEQNVLCNSPNCLVPSRNPILSNGVEKGKVDFHSVSTYELTVSALAILSILFIYKLLNRSLAGRLNIQSTSTRENAFFRRSNRNKMSLMNVIKVHIILDYYQITSFFINKKVKYDKLEKITFIPSRAELISDGFAEDLWYTNKKINFFKRDFYQKVTSYQLQQSFKTRGITYRNASEELIELECLSEDMVENTPAKNN